jgi:glycosyltransferase involved in cell wall biosynthesis
MGISGMNPNPDHRRLTAGGGRAGRQALRRLWRRLRGINERCISLPPIGGADAAAPRGRVLLSYILDGVMARSEQDLPHSHPHFWETWAMARVFQEEGYAVDVIHWTRRGPLPRADYDIYVDVRRNFDRHAAILPPACLKIAHMDTAHFRVHNGNQDARLQALQRRRGIVLPPFKRVEENGAAEQADRITILGNAFTAESFAYAGTPVHRIRLSNAFVYPFPENKDFDRVRHRFLWMGSEGFVHKGLDLVLEAFRELPRHELVVCGPLGSEPDFVKAFSDLLFDTPNIHVEGWVDVSSPRFRELADSCLGMVYPSCSEGGGGCVITAMHAGLIPIVSRETSVDLDADCGILLPESSVEAIAAAVRQLSGASADRLALMARNAWRRVRENHTRERFMQEYREFVRGLPAAIQEKRRGLQAQALTPHEQATGREDA